MSAGNGEHSIDGDCKNEKALISISTTSSYRHHEKSNSRISALAASLTTISSTTTTGGGDDDDVSLTFDENWHKIVAEKRTHLALIVEEHVKECIDNYLSCTLSHSGLIRLVLAMSGCHRHRRPDYQLTLNDFVRQCLKDYLNCIESKLNANVSFDALLSEVTDKADYSRSVTQSVEATIVKLVSKNIIQSQSDARELSIENLVGEPIKKIKNLLETFKNVLSLYQNVQLQSSDLLSSITTSHSNENEKILQELLSFTRDHEMMNWHTRPTQTQDKNLLFEDFLTFLDGDTTGHSKTKNKDSSFKNECANIIDLSSSILSYKTVTDSIIDLNDKRHIEHNPVTMHEKEKSCSLIKSKMDDLTVRLNRFELMMNAVHSRFDQLSALMLTETKCNESRRTFQNQGVQVTEMCQSFDPTMSSKECSNKSTQITPEKIIDVNPSTPTNFEARFNQTSNQSIASPERQDAATTTTIIATNKKYTSQKDLLQTEIEKLKMDKKSIMQTIQQLHNLNRKLRDDLQKMKKSYDDLKKTHKKW